MEIWCKPCDAFSGNYQSINIWKSTCKRRDRELPEPKIAMMLG